MHPVQHYNAKFHLVAMICEHVSTTTPEISKIKSAFYMGIYMHKNILIIILHSQEYSDMNQIIMIIADSIHLNKAFDILYACNFGNF